MCVPITPVVMFAASLAMTGIQAYTQYQGQKQMAQAQAETQQENYQKNYDATVVDMQGQYADINARQDEDHKATAQNIFNRSLEARRAKSTALATSEAAGLSIDRLMQDYDRQYLNFSDAQMRQLGFNTAQLDRARESVEAQGKSRINSFQFTPIQQPSLGSAIVEFGASAFNSYDKFTTPDPVTGKRTF